MAEARTTAAAVVRSRIVHLSAMDADDGPRKLPVGCRSAVGTATRRVDRSGPLGRAVMIPTISTSETACAATDDDPMGLALRRSAEVSVILFPQVQALRQCLTQGHWVMTRDRRYSECR